jgi:hypothetical protein
MISFEQAYAKWRALPFPPGSTHDDIDELHADLVLIDDWVAEAVIPFVENGLKLAIKVDVVGGLQRLRDGLKPLVKAGAADDKELIRRYLEYTDALEDVYASFRREPEPS